MEIPHISQPGALAAISEALFGANWRRPLAQALAPYRPRRPGRPVDDSSLYAWSSGSVPTPRWVLEALPHVAADVAHEHRRRARAAFQVSLAAAGVSEEEVDALRRAQAAKEEERRAALLAGAAPAL
ncbi:MAG: hypothetical protein DI601_00210 [Azospirillum brasilense]|nr:MAG: hypothetical protein DI601_00210 [Azospirillum brasilense]